jgi:CspA family cold shock protein
VHTGSLKFFKPDAGYGFISNDANGEDFLHASELRLAGIDPHTLQGGERFSYEVAPGRNGKTQAVNVTSLD